MRLHTSALPHHPSAAGDEIRSFISPLAVALMLHLPSSAECIRRNFGGSEVLRIRGQEGVWSCLFCNPKPLKKLWKLKAGQWGAKALLMTAEEKGTGTRSTASVQ